MYFGNMYFGNSFKSDHRTFSLKVCSMYFSGGGDEGDVGRLRVTRDLLAPSPAGFSARIFKRC
jgi:hypothetical protein